MAFTTGSIKVKGRLYDMTGITNYTQSNGVDLGLVSDLVMPEFERDVQVYSSMGTGSTPRYATIDGEGLLLRFGLSEYDAAVVKLISQNMRPTGANENYLGPTATIATAYSLGNILTTSHLLSLLIVDKDDPADYPALYIPAAVVVRVHNLSFSPAEGMMDPATFEVIGLYNSTIGGCFALGDKSKFPSLS